MIIQNRDGSLIEEPSSKRLWDKKEQRYAASVPVHLLDEQNSLIDRLISFAFDTLGALHLEVRVRDHE